MKQVILHDMRDVPIGRNIMEYFRKDLMDSNFNLSTSPSKNQAKWV